MGGIIALKKDECHAAPTHLLSPDGTYNTAYIRKYLPGTEVDLISLPAVSRVLYPVTGSSFSDLPGRMFINRQKGSGTRMLLDYELMKAKIDPASLPGYEREVTTHIAVALAVKSREADAGHVRLQRGKSTRAPVHPGSTGTVRARYTQGTHGGHANQGTDRCNPFPKIHSDTRPPWRVRHQGNRNPAIG